MDDNAVDALSVSGEFLVDAAAVDFARPARLRPPKGPNLPGYAWMHATFPSPMERNYGGFQGVAKPGTDVGGW
jgi:hypothetical protein